MSKRFGEVSAVDGVDLDIRDGEFFSLLGGSGWQTLRWIVIPNVAGALLAGAILAFALSFDEIIVTTFTAGDQETLPIWMFSSLNRPRNRPVLNVVALIVMAMTLLPIIAAQRIARESGGGGRI